ncbi:bifunctional 2',3'-cyclic-nucleotide 2'-phosphodiesterase/3'-nucleotidase [Rhodobacter sp. NTK016B]|uniref:bifunctional 2',3'-cyclic-nucleotide 2'-phosphodiesterase/3'-nucleotidase n=1 Tax=Rhodobacter sp. NTK016B TaxID=2759676 RepID=UPI0032E4161A
MIERGNALLNPLTFSGFTAGQRGVHLRIIETTDLHLHLMPYDYYADRPAKGVGLANAARMIETARGEARNTVLFDNGDFLQGTPMGDYVAHETQLAEGDLHPVIGAMNALRYDAITLGNHEFNYGIDFLMTTLARAEFPIVSSNLITRKGASPREDQTLVRPYVLLDRVLQDENGFDHPIRIGIIGFAPPQVTMWDSQNLAGRLDARDIVDSARAWIPEMREAGADIVVALAHTGIGAARHSDGMENAAIPLARSEGIDAILTGHSHLLFPSPVFDKLPDVDVATGTIAGKPAVMAGCWGAHIGLIDLLLTRDGGTWRVLGTRSEARAVTPDSDAPHDPDPRVTEAVSSHHERTLTAIRRPVGEAKETLHSYFSHLGVTASLRVVAEAQRRYVSERLSGTLHESLPILSAVAPYKSGGRGGPQGYTMVPKGPVALRHLADLYPFPNAIAALRLTGAQVIEWLERSAAAFNRIRPGSQETPLRNNDVPGYNFEVIHPLDVVYDLSQPARYDPAGALIDPEARRVVQASLDGAALDPEAHYILCTNSYRAGGAGAFSGAETANIVLSDARVTRDILCDHVSAQGGLSAERRGSLLFTALEDTSAIFETGPEARHFLTDIETFRPVERGLTRGGFLRLKVDLSGGV